MLELIAIGSWLFWVILALAFIWEFIAVGREEIVPTVIVPIITVATMCVFSSFKIVDFCKEGWKSILVAMGTYVIMACLWALFKWYRLCVNRANIYKNCLETWAEKNMPSDIKITSVNDIPMDKRSEFFKVLRDSFYNIEHKDWFIDGYFHNLAKSFAETGVEYANREREMLEKLQGIILKKVLSSPKENKERITVWMIAWPFSVITTFVFDFFYDFFGWLRKSLVNVFISISRISFGKYRKDFENIKVEKEI